eukprot:392459_1
MGQSISVIRGIIPAINNKTYNSVPHIASEEMTQFREIITKRTYREQAIFFLNAMWKEYRHKPEDIWSFVQTADESDQMLGAQGSALAEFDAHRFLEQLDESLTVFALRNIIREININGDNTMSLLEYLIYHYKVDITTMMTRTQHQSVSVDVDRAEAALKVVLDQFENYETTKLELMAKITKGGVQSKVAQHELSQLNASDRVGIH